MNLEFWILDGIQNLRTPAADVLMPFITSFGNGGVIWIVLTVILLLIPKTRKTGLILAAALILGNILQFVSEKSGEKDPSLRYQ